MDNPASRWWPLTGAALLVCAGLLAQLLAQVLAHLSPLPPGASLSDSAVSSHLGLLLAALLPTALGGGLALAFGAWRGRQDSASLMVFQGLAWGMRAFMLLLPAALIGEQFTGMVDPYGPAHMLPRGSFAGAMIFLTVLLVLPLSVLTWVLLGRLIRWMQAVNRHTPAPAPGGTLQRQFRAVNHPLLAASAVLGALGLFLLPIQMIDRAPAIAIQTPLEKLMQDQQIPLMQLVMLAALIGSVTLWMWRGWARDLTHELDPQHSRISRLLRSSQPPREAPP